MMLMLLRILRVIEIVPAHAPVTWTPFELSLPSGSYWFRKNANFGSVRMRYNADTRTAVFGERTIDALYLSGEVKAIPKPKEPSIGGP